MPRVTGVARRLELTKDVPPRIQTSADSLLLLKEPTNFWSRAVVDIVVM